MRELTKELSDVASFKNVVDGEAVSVLNMAAKRTGKASKEIINIRYAINDSHKIKGVRTPQNKKMVGRVKVGGKWHNTRFLYPDAKYRLIKAKMAKLKKSALSRINSAKAVWYAAAKKANLPMAKFQGTAKYEKALRAQWRTFTDRANLRGDQIKASGKYAVEVFSAHGALLNNAVKGKDALQHSMAGRVKYFETNLKKGVFDKCSTIAKRYPSIVLIP